MFFLVGSLSVGIEVSNETRNIRIMSVRFEAESMLECYSICEDEVHGCHFLKEICGALFAFAFADVDPDVAGEVTALDHECAPGFSAFRISVFNEHGSSELVMEDVNRS